MAGRALKLAHSRKGQSRLSDNEGRVKYHAPNADHVSNDYVNRRALYRHIERMAGMTVPQRNRNCMGDEVPAPLPRPEEIYAHVLKAIRQFGKIGAEPVKAD
jgi:hypothetical protein